MDIKLRAYIGVETDIEALWQDIERYEGIILGGARNKYTIKYDGDLRLGRNILDYCLNHAKGECEFEIKLIS